MSGAGPGDAISAAHDQEARVTTFLPRALLGGLSVWKGEDGDYPRVTFPNPRQEPSRYVALAPAE